MRGIRDSLMAIGATLLIAAMAHAFFANDAQPTPKSIDNDVEVSTPAPLPTLPLYSFPPVEYPDLSSLTPLTPEPIPSTTPSSPRIVLDPTMDLSTTDSNYCGIWITEEDYCDDTNKVGNEWTITHYVSIDGSEYQKVSPYGAWFSVADPITIQVKTVYVEDDEYPDSNENVYSMDINTDQSSVQNETYWEINQWTDVTENNGNYAGRTCTWYTDWTITFLYSGVQGQRSSPSPTPAINRDNLDTEMFYVTISGGDDIPEWLNLYLVIKDNYGSSSDYSLDESGGLLEDEIELVYPSEVTISINAELNYDHLNEYGSIIDSRISDDDLSCLLDLYDGAFEERSDGKLYGEMLGSAYLEWMPDHEEWEEIECESEECSLSFEVTLERYD